MELYSCTVRVAGSLRYDVFKTGLTASDVIMLRHLHGDDMIVDVKHIGRVERSDSEQRELLRQTYGTGEFESSASGEVLIQRVFGTQFTKLPRKLEDVEHMKKSTKLIEDPNVVRASDEPEKESDEALFA